MTQAQLRVKRYEYQHHFNSNAIAASKCRKAGRYDLAKEYAANASEFKLELDEIEKLMTESS